MKVGIIGAGAMGSIFSYFFYKAKIDVVIFEKDSKTIISLNKGIDIIKGDKIEEIYVCVDSKLEILKECEFVFVFVKSYDTEEAIIGVQSAIEEDCIIVSLQNGIGNKEIIAKYFSEERIVYGSTSIGAARTEDGSVRLGGMGNIVIGGSSVKAVKSVEEILKMAGLDVNVSDNPEAVIWEKAIINAGINPIGALLDISNGSIIKNEYAKKIQEELVKEAVAIAWSVGLTFDADEMIEQTRSVCEKTAGNICSMLQDKRAHRRTEIDSINGIIIEYGRKNSITTPYNNAVYYLIKAQEII